LLDASSDYVNAQDLDAGQPLPFIPPLRGLLRATWQDQRWMGTVEWRMAARQTRLGAGDTPTAGVQAELRAAVLRRAGRRERLAVGGQPRRQPPAAD